VICGAGRPAVANEETVDFGTPSEGLGAEDLHRTFESSPTGAFPPPQSGTACATCGATLEIGAKFCWDCGSRVEARRPEPPPVEVAPPPPPVEVVPPPVFEPPAPVDVAPQPAAPPIEVAARPAAPQPAAPQPAAPPPPVLEPVAAPEPPPPPVHVPDMHVEPAPRAISYETLVEPQPAAPPLAPPPAAPAVEETAARPSRVTSPHLREVVWGEDFDDDLDEQTSVEPVTVARERDEAPPRDDASIGLLAGMPWLAPVAAGFAVFALLIALLVHVFAPNVVSGYSPAELDLKVQMRAVEWLLAGIIVALVGLLAKR
jgi:hypothetical protein